MNREEKLRQMIDQDRLAQRRSRATDGAIDLLREIVDRGQVVLDRLDEALRRSPVEEIGIATTRGAKEH